MRLRRVGASRTATRGLTYKCLPSFLRRLFPLDTCGHRAHCPAHALIRVFEDVGRYFVIARARLRFVAVRPKPGHATGLVLCATGIAHFEEQRIAADDCEKHVV